MGATVPAALTIRALRVRPLDLPIERPVETAAGVLRTAPLVLLDLLTEEGIAGHSYVRCYTAVALQPLARLIANLEPLVAGAPADPTAIERRLTGHFRLLGPQGLTGIAMAALDMALWDAQARAADLPLVRLLGGEPHPIPTYASLRSMEPRAAAGEAGAALARGFRAVKLKVGPATDLAAIETVRAVIGDADLMVDYNQSLSIEQALERIPRLDEQGLAWIEEPTLAEDFAGHARIAAAARTLIQLGENWWGVADMEKSIAAQASDHVMLDAMKIGGVSGWLRSAELAARAQLPTSSHTFPEISAHLLAVTPTCHRLEYLGHANRILREPLQIEDGYALPADRAGSGIEWDEELLASRAATGGL
jgi:mandelate racemase